MWIPNSQISRSPDFQVPTKLAWARLGLGWAGLGRAWASGRVGPWVGRVGPRVWIAARAVMDWQYAWRTFGSK